MIETFIKALSEKCLQVNSQSARKTAINITSNTIYIRILTYYITLHLTKNFGVVQQSRQAKFNIYTPPTLAGLFFCLASAEGAGLLFYPATIQPNTSVYSAFCAVNAQFTIHAIKQHTELCSGFSCDYARSTARDTRQTQATIIPHTPRWSVSQRRSASSEYRYQHHAGRYTGQHSRPIIIRYIRAQRCAPVIDPCQTVQRIADHANPTGQSDSRCAAGGAEPLTALAVSLSGFRPITNRGQQ